MKKIVKDTILVLTNTGEDTVNSVIQHFRKVNQPFLRVNTDKLFRKYVGLELNGSRSAGFVTFGKKLELDRVKSVLYRHPEPLVLPKNVPQKYAEFILGEYHSFLWSLYTSLDVFWMNSPIAISPLEHNKLKHRLDAARIGLRIPATLITNDSKKILNFCKQQKGRVALKTIRPSLFTQEGKRSHSLVFTTPISAKNIIGREAEIRLAPVMVQEYVEKKLEFRLWLPKKFII